MCGIYIAYIFFNWMLHIIPGSDILSIVYVKENFKLSNYIYKIFLKF